MVFNEIVDRGARVRLIMFALTNACGCVLWLCADVARCGCVLGLCLCGCAFVIVSL